ncbi:MAG: pyridoxamine 5'-phosphate oxidase family protein [Clostridiales bacterium]|nr:pyridoxamine 5'-phosphate oxidase family protein [Clostridiales bacterium]
MRRFNQQISYEKCYEILKEQWRGVLSVNGDSGYPHSFPMDFYFDEVNGKLYFHCAKEGYKIRLLTKDPATSFCVYDEGYREEGEWALNISSVICYGRIRSMEDGDEKYAVLRSFGRKYYESDEAVEEEIRKAGSRVNMLEFTIDRMTGKLVNES